MTEAKPAQGFPSGTLTFMFTDLEGSTRLWEQHPDEMKVALARHDTILRAAVEENEGLIVKTTGDGLHAVFKSAKEATKSALTAQQLVAAESWPAKVGPLRIRIGLHTGLSQLREGDYYGSEVNRAARIMSIGYGGQVLLSETTANLIQENLPQSSSLLDLGEQILRDLSQPGNIFQLCHPDLQLEFPQIKSLAAFKHNLPIQLTSFVGRDAEIARIHHLLTKTRVLCLVGPGGTGKTRLMLQAGAEIVDHFKDGVWLIELASLSDPDRLWAHLAAAFRVQEQPGRAISDTLIDFLRPKEALVLMDNVEHLVDASAELAERLVTTCPDIRFLVTGREPLNIAGETVLKISPLPVPSEIDIANVDQVSSSTAVQLFIDRARAANPDFSLTSSNARAVGEITRRLDGIPLALELAASRTQMLPVEQIADRLNDRFRLLTGGRRTALPRQQTLEALIDWSWNLLDEQEQSLFRRLSVFSGGWTLEAADSVAAQDAFDNLAQLVNKSLVIVDHLPEGEVRYRMLESIQEYAWERLKESGDQDVVEELHASYFHIFADKANSYLRGPEMPPWLGRIRFEVENIRKMFDWMLKNQPETAMGLAGRLFHSRVYWISPQEARSWLEASMERSARDETEMNKVDLAAAQIGLGIQLHNQGNYSASAEAIDEGFELARKYEDPLLIVRGLNAKILAGSPETGGKTLQLGEEAIAISRQNDFKIELATSLGITAYANILVGNLETGHQYIQEAIELAQEYGNLWMIASFHRLRGNMNQTLGDLNEARQYYLEALKVFEELGNRYAINSIRSDLAENLRMAGDMEAAETLYEDTILGWQEEGHQPMIAHQLECFAYLAMARQEYLRAVKLIGAAQAIREDMDVDTRLPNEKTEFAEAMVKLKETLGEAERDAEINEDRPMDTDEAIQFALSHK